MIGQQRQLPLAPMFSYQLCAVPLSLVDEFECLWRGRYSGQQLLYHVMWPSGGDPSISTVIFQAETQF